MMDGLRAVFRPGSAVSGTPSSIEMPTRKKVTVAAPFPIYPPVSGGQLRILSLFRRVAQALDVELVSIADAGSPLLELQVAPGVKEIRVPRSVTHQQTQELIAGSTSGIDIAGVVIPLLFRHSPEYLRHLARSMDTADLVVTSYPFCLPAIRTCRGHQPLLYDAHNVEYLLYEELFSKSGAPQTGLLDIVREVEAQTCRSSALTLACSKDDKDTLCRLYGVEPTEVLVVPNGVDLGRFRFIPLQERNRGKTKVGLGGQRIAIFIGSWHPPNLEACESIFLMAGHLPDVRFLLVGGQCVPLESRSRPSNVKLMGVVDDSTLTALLSLADVALNPMLGGSGTNHKMATYFAAGVPVVTTPQGARGYDVMDGVHALICPVEEFPARIAQIFSSPRLAEEIASGARRLVEQRYDWSMIGAEVGGALLSLLDRSAPSRSTWRLR